MEIAHLALSTIRLGARKRQVDATVVQELAQSIERQGLLQPIGVKTSTTGDDPNAPLRWEVVFGAHRLAAYALLRRETIEARILPAGLRAEAYLLMELEENSARNDLTSAQRKGYAGDIGALIAKLADDSSVAVRNEKWLSDFATTTHVAQRTMYDWWSAFAKAHGLTFPPREALDVHKGNFFEWLQTHRAAETAEKARKDAEVAAARQQQELREGLENLELLARDYGRQVVIDEVIDVFLHQPHEETVT